MLRMLRDFDLYRVPGEFVKTKESIEIQHAIEGIIKIVIESTQAPTYFTGIREAQLFTVSAVSTIQEVMYFGKMIGNLDREELQYLAFEIMSNYGFIEEGKSVVVSDERVSPYQPGLKKETQIWPSTKYKNLGFVRIRRHFTDNERKDQTTDAEWSVVDLRTYENAFHAAVLQSNMPDPNPLELFKE